MCHIEPGKIQCIKDRIEELRNRLNFLTGHSQNMEFDDEIIGLSQDLDKLLNTYYKLNMHD